MKIQIATRQTVRLLIAILYLGSLISYIAHLGTVGVSGMSAIEIVAMVVTAATWATAGLHSCYRRACTKVWEIRHGSADEEVTLIRPSTHSTINSVLQMTSSASAITGVLYKAPNLTRVNYLSLTASLLWFSWATTICGLSRVSERRREDSPDEDIRLCGIRPEVFAIASEVQIELSGVLMACAIWLNDPVYPLRVAGNNFWLSAAAVGLMLAIYEYVEARQANVEQEVEMAGVVVEDVTEDNEPESSYSASLTPSSIRPQH